MLRTSEAFVALLYDQRPRFFLWVPLWLGAGIATYFALRFEPGLASYATALGAVLAGLIGAWRGGDVLRVLAWIPALVALGFLLAGLRAHMVAAPKLTWRYYGGVEGRVVHIDRSVSNVPRVTLAEPILSRVAPQDTPARVRVALHGKHSGTPLAAGARIMVTAHLAPPGGPVEPGGFDFQRMAWFDRLGAVGYARAPPVLARPADPGDWQSMVFRWRMSVADGLRAAIPGQRGAFAAAILTGDRSAIDPKHLEDLRRSNLAHLLAISGLHMGLLTGFVFLVIRFGFACVPPVALRLPTKKIAAVVALLAGAAYLVMSGANIATQRAFVMVAVMLVAVLADRAAISLRAVAIAAVIILCLRPESLAEPGFQMSFAATTALVAVFEGLNRAPWWQELSRGRLRIAMPVISLLVASAVAAAATAPIAAFHFNRVAHFGLIANLASVPVMGSVVMPAGVVAGVLSLVGLDGPALWVMGQGIGWILAVAAWVASLDGAITHVPSAPAPALVLICLGGLFPIIWRGRARWAGAGVVLAGVALWAGDDRPDILISEDGKLVGVVTDAGRALNKAKGSGFAAETWLENDGDGGTQAQAAQRVTLDKGRWQMQAGPITVAYDARKEAEGTCVPGGLLILPKSNAQGRGCVTLNAARLAEGGAAAVKLRPDGLSVVQVRDVTGTRLWNQK